MIHRRGLRAAIKHPLFPLYVIFLWGAWLTVKVLPERAAGEEGSLLLLSLLALVVYAIPVAIVLAAFGPRK